MRSEILAIVAVGISSVAMGATYNADLGATGQPVAVGWTGPAGTVGFNAPSTPTVDFGGGVSLSIATSVGNYGFGIAENPVVQDGFFIAGGEAHFTLSGLTPGDKVTLYAIHAWDGNARAAFVSFGGSALVDTSTPDDIFWNTSPLPAYAADPQPSDMVLIAADVVANLDGEVSGYFTGISGDIIRPEGQIGGMIFEVTPVPEPASAVALGACGMGLGLLRRRH